jgi:hypothetical protein
MTRRSAGEEADERSGFGLQKVAERTGNPTEQRLILKDGRSLGFAEYGDPKGEPVLEFHGCPSCRLQARNYDEAAPDPRAQSDDVKCPIML